MSGVCDFQIMDSDQFWASDWRVGAWGCVSIVVHVEQTPGKVAGTVPRRPGRRKGWISRVRLWPMNQNLRACGRESTARWRGVGVHSWAEATPGSL